MKKTKSKIADKTDRIIHTVYFSPKKRSKLKKDFKNLLEYMRAVWDLKEEELKEYDLDKETVVHCTDTSVKILKMIETARKWRKKLKMRNKSFGLYKHKDGHKLLIEFNFVRSVSGKRDVSTWVLAEGLPGKSKVVNCIWYKRRLSKKGYKQIDSGTFFQRIVSLTEACYTLKGIAKTIKLNITVPITVFENEPIKLKLRLIN